MSRDCNYHDVPSKLTFCIVGQKKYKERITITLLEGVNAGKRLDAINLSLLDDKTGQWITGSMKIHFSLWKQKYTIQLNGRRVFMEKELLFPYTTFLDESKDGTLLARFQREFFSPMIATMYGVQIYSNDIPDGLYLLVLAWSDIGRSESYGISRRKTRHLYS
jgi:hypothetical protein